MRVYLDHNATTPLREEVLEAVVRTLRDCTGNPSSTHAAGAAARRVLERAREQVAELLGVAPARVLFTSGASEANNAALQGALRARQERGRHVVTTQVEHPSVVEPLAALECEGWSVTRVGVDADGLLDVAAFADALRPDTVLVSVLWANNETGVIQPLEQIAALARERGIQVHVDATQRLGKLAVDLSGLPVDLLAGSGHKLNAPKGIGLLALAEGLEIEPWIRGGPQERGRRGGTENVAGAVGLGVACALARAELESRAAQDSRLRDRLWAGIAAKVPRVRRNGAPSHVLPNTLNVEFEGCAGDVLMEALDLEGVCVSAGAACASGSVTPSHVLAAMGRTPEQARGALRFSVGHGVDEAQIDHVLALLPDLVQRAREALAP